MSATGISQDRDGLAIEADERFRDRFEFVACDICSGTNLRVVHPSTLVEDDILHSVDQHTYAGWTNSAGRIVECLKCSLRFISPRDRQPLIWEAYRDIVDPLYLEALDSRRVAFRRGLASLERFRRPPGRLLDVGCSVGLFLELARDSGWEAEGVEASKWSAAQARDRGLSVHNQVFEEVRLPEASFDVVCFWDVLEHVPSPRLVLERAHRILRPGGVLVVSTPNARSLSAVALGRRWWFIERDHLFYYTPASLALQLRESGFRPQARRIVVRTYPARYLAQKVSAYLPGVGATARRALDLAGVGGAGVSIPAGQMTMIALKEDSAGAR